MLLYRNKYRNSGTIKEYCLDHSCVCFGPGWKVLWMR